MANFEESNSRNYFSNTTRTSPMLISTRIDSSSLLDQSVDIESLLYDPYPVDRVSKGKVTVEKGFCSLYQYENQSNPGRILLYAYRKFCGFEIYRKGENKDSFIGSLKSNLIGTEYVLRTKDGNILSIKYHTAWFKRRKPRTFTVLFYKNVDKVDISKYPIVMRNKEPFHNSESNSYSLNFNGRVTTPSVKNFQLVHPLDPTYITLTFGKISPTTYIMDHTYPLSAFLGFSVALGALDKKLFCD
jgi:hypothetical protein